VPQNVPSIRCIRKWLLFAVRSLPQREALLQTVLELSDEDLDNIEIDRRDVGYVRKAGDFILRIAYHEAVHAGQMLQYLRMAGVPRPSIWD